MLAYTHLYTTGFQECMSIFLIRVVISSSLDALRRPYARPHLYAILGQASSFASTTRSSRYTVLLTPVVRPG